MMMMVSFYKNIKDTIGVAAPLPTILDGIKAGKWQKQVTTYRALRTKEGKKGSESVKKKLPNFTGSGWFYEREDRFLKQHSGRIIIDFDELEDVNNTKSILCRDKFTEYCFLSCSGAGLAVLVKISPNKHRDSFKGLKEYYSATYNLKVDESCVNESRSRFISYDIDLFHNSEADTFEVKKNDIPKKRTITSYTDAHKVLKPAIEIIERSSEGNRHHNRLKAGKLAGGYVAGGDVSHSDALSILMDAVRSVSDCNDRNLDKCEKEINSAIEHGKQFPTTFEDRKKFAKDNDPNFNQVPPPPNEALPPPIAPIDYIKEIQDQSILDEDFFKNATNETPRFNSEVYDELPDLIAIGCQYFEGVQKDTFLFSSLITLSSAFENVHFKYFGKIQYPNLYGFVLAPAAFGKGGLTWARHLVKGIDKLKIDEYNEEVERIKQEAEEEKKKKIELPTTRCHIIPANISGAGLSKLLNANTCVLAMAMEIDDLANAMSQEWGKQLSSTLRTAYHHEEGGQYRATNDEMTKTENAKMSTLFTGTHGQFFKMMPSTENGLFSRFCIYSTHESSEIENPFDDKYEGMYDIFNSIQQDVTSKYLAYYRSGKRFAFTADQQYTFFSKMKEENKYYTQLLGGESSQIVRRHFFMTIRIAIILTCCRYDATQFDEEIICEDRDFYVAFDLMNTLKKHAFCAFNQIQGNSVEEEAAPKINAKGKRMMLFERLPNDFTTADAYKVGESLKLTNSHISNILGYLKRCEFIFSEKQGKYKKNESK